MVFVDVMDESLGFWHPLLASQDIDYSDSLRIFRISASDKGK